MYIAGTIVSPNYPKYYDDNQERRYKIIAPMLSEIVLIFSSFDVQYSDDCISDYLEVSTCVIINLSKNQQYIT